jgi:hypothetical protein
LGNVFGEKLHANCELFNYGALPFELLFINKYSMITLVYGVEATKWLNMNSPGLKPGVIDYQLINIPRCTV